MRSLILILVIVTLVSCSESRVFEDYKDFTTKSWLVNDTVSFEFQITDPAVPYRLNANVRNTLDYPYSRIFINYTLEDSTHKVLTSKLVSSYLFDGKTGEPNGDSGIGDIYDYSFNLENRKFAPGKYYIKLQQFMRTDTLKGVLAAGARVEKIELK